MISDSASREERSETIMANKAFAAERKKPRPLKSNLGCKNVKFYHNFF